MLRIGIVGLSGCGKTSLFRALTPVRAVEIGAIGKRETHLGQATVPDPRLDELNLIFQRPKLIHTSVEYVDVGGLAPGEAAKAALEGSFLAEIRTCDALLQVLRKFSLPGFAEPDPARDFRSAEQEFLLADQIILEKRLERLRKEAQKNPQSELKRKAELLERCLVTLNQERPLRELDLPAIDEPFLRPYQPLTLKPQLVVINLPEDEVAAIDEIAVQFRPQIGGEGVEIAATCASIEMEIAQLDEESACEFRSDLGITTSALDRLIQASYRLLGLISFFTIKGDECRAWTLKRGKNAREAAGVVHTDMERGFIRAEVVNFGDFQQHGSFAACRSAGVLRLEGRNYIVQDGDIIEFRFAV
ncbi:MAG: DUF933 domain-containing protein [bacterium]